MDCEYGGDVSGLECALSRMTEAVCGLLVGCRPSVYLYGSAVSGDFRLGWSDLDVLVLTREPIPPSAAEALVSLRQTMTAAEPDNVYYRLFEGECCRCGTFCPASRRAPSTGVRAGNGSQTAIRSTRLAAAASRAGPAAGRRRAARPAAAAVVRRAARRRGGASEGRPPLCGCDGAQPLFVRLAAGRCARTLYNSHGRVASKTDAGRWALQNALCPDPELLETALCVREAPLRLRDDPRTLDLAESLGDAVQRFADVLEEALR